MRWEVKDEHLDLKTLSLEYQADGARQWRKVPIRRPSLLGAETWDAGTADSLRVRASVADKAGNVAETQIVLPEGTAGDSDFAAVDAEPPGRRRWSRFPGPARRLRRDRDFRRSRRVLRPGPRLLAAVRLPGGRSPVGPRLADRPYGRNVPPAPNWGSGAGRRRRQCPAHEGSRRDVGPRNGSPPPFANPFPTE